MTAYNACIDAKRTAVIAALAESAAQRGKAGGTGYQTMRTLAFSPPVAALPAECRGRRALDSSATAAEIAQFNACAAARSEQKAAVRTRSSSFDHSVDTPTLDAKANDKNSTEIRGGEAGLHRPAESETEAKAEATPDPTPEATSATPEPEDKDTNASAAPHEEGPRPQAMGMTLPATITSRRSDQ